jgi:hypothetical protein
VIDALIHVGSWRRAVDEDGGRGKGDNEPDRFDSYGPA